MKNRTLVILGLAVLALLALRFLLTRGEGESVQDLEDAGVARVLASPPKAEDVLWIRVSAPAAPPVEGAEPAPPAAPLLVRRVAGGPWTVASAHDAPAEAAQVDEFLKAVLELAGEERGEGESVRAEFGVDDAQAVKVELGGADANAPLATLFVGKQGDGPESHFVMAAGSSAIRHASQGLRRKLGLWSADAKPAADHWLKKQLVQADEPKLKSLSLARPDLALELRAEPGPAVEAPAEGAAPAPPARTWTVAAPALPWPLRADAIAGVVGRAGSVRVDAALDPAACASGGATSTLSLAQEDGVSHVLSVGAKLADADRHALQLAGDPHCYAVASWSLASLLPRASALWDVPPAFANAPPSSDVTRVTVQRDGATIRLVKAGETEWKIESPRTGAAQAGRVSRLVTALLNLRFDDVAEAGKVPPALLDKSATVTVEAGGRRLAVVLLGERVGGAPRERYARLEGGTVAPAGFVGVLSSATVDALLPALDEL